MALMDKHKQVKRQRLDRICEGELASTLTISKNLSIRNSMIQNANSTNYDWLEVKSDWPDSKSSFINSFIVRLV